MSLLRVIRENCQHCYSFPECKEKDLKNSNNFPWEIHRFSKVLLKPGYRLFPKCNTLAGQLNGIDHN